MFNVAPRIIMKRATVVSTLLFLSLATPGASSRYSFRGESYFRGFGNQKLVLVVRGGNIIDPSNQNDPISNASEATTTTETTVPGNAEDAVGSKRGYWGRKWGGHAASLKTHFDETFKKRQLNLTLPKMDVLSMENLKEGSSRMLSFVGPAAVAFCELFYNRQQTPITLPAIVSLALLGASSGFYLFLYFITVGYALGITLPLLAAVVAYNTYPDKKIPTLTNVHSGLVLVWGVRAASFFLYRELVNWPELHEKIVEVNKSARLEAKFFCWIVFSFFYVSMITPCLFRLASGKSWGVFGMFAIGLQTCGLLLESIADYQKSSFKVQPGNRNHWCHVGLWKISTHPNYLGEMLFWIGTYLGGLSCYRTVGQWIVSTIGLLFVLVVIRGAISTLGAKHLRKYGNDVEFLEFRRTHSVFGPFHWTPLPKNAVSL